MPNKNEVIDSHLQSRLDNYIAEASKLCAQPSVSARSEGTKECGQLVVEILKNHSLQVQSFQTPGNPVIVGRVKGRSSRTLLFYNHYDVQPPEPLELWTSPPFKPTVRNGALYARGAKDDKGELIARLAAMDAVRSANGGELPCSVTFIVEGEEEIGSPHIAQFVQENLSLLKCDGAIWEEGSVDSQDRPVLSLGRRGILAVELEAQTMKRDAHSGGASTLPNASWRLLWALASLKGPDERIRIPGFYDQALPPTKYDLELIAAQPSDEAQVRAEFGLKEFLRNATGEAYKCAVFEPTCNIQGFGSGYQGSGIKTVIPARATAKVDFRLVPNQDPKDIFEKLRHHLNQEGFSDVNVKWLGAMWPNKVAGDHPLVALTARAGEEVYGKPSVLVPMTGGSSPVYAFADPLKISVV
ncbi:M20/M25/M40 family metallo-hydrolase, partial [Candidatus Acetothermia bacterium]|nr:M20/M25/M40 family metallo-hydrolase [Candidatus Acetothermia bacterium]